MAYNTIRRQTHIHQPDHETIRTRTRFRAIDGEATRRPDGQLNYALLGTDTTHLTAPDKQSQIPTLDILRWLWQQHRQDPHAVWCGFYLSWDFTHWLRDLPQEIAVPLLVPEATRAYETAHPRTYRSNGKNRSRAFRPVTWEGWELQMSPTFKQLTIRNRAAGALEDIPPMVINDVGPIFQQSFQSVLDGWGDQIGITPIERAIIDDGKARRGDVPPTVDPEWVLYNQTENILLGRIMDLFAGSVEEAAELDLNNRQWYGPGPIAQQWLANRGTVPTADTVRRTLPADVFEAAGASYYGGWFETPLQGHVGRLWEYDINSAYPHALTTVPCLEHAHWDYNTEPEPGTLALVRGTFTSHPDANLGPLSHRCHSGLILHPTITEGWHWLHEIEAAGRARLLGDAHFTDVYTYRRNCDCLPLAEVADLYNERLRVGKNTPHGKGLKIVYNSAYGKLAQTKGYPRYLNKVWASYTTSRTRTMILDAIATHPQRSWAVAMIATDGVYFTSPHPAMDIDPERLGAWDVQELTDAYIFKPGIWWNGAKLKSRGVSAKGLAPQVAQVSEHLDRWELDEAQVPLLVGVHMPFAYITARLAARRGWHMCGRTELGARRVVSSWIPPERGRENKRANYRTPVPGLVRSDVPTPHSIVSELRDSTERAAQERAADMEWHHVPPDLHRFFSVTEGLEVPDYANLGEMLRDGNFTMEIINGQ